MTRGIGLALLVLASGILLLAITLAWSSVQSLGDDRELTLDEAMALTAPSVEEEKKRAVLRALKDLEYERSVGKISEEDYAKLSTRYREEAKTLLRVLDSADAPGREKAERLVKKRLERAGLLASTPKQVEAAAAPVEIAAAADAEPASGPFEGEPALPDAQDEIKTCGECSTDNDRDARFCKQCGTPLG